MRQTRRPTVGRVLGSPRFQPRAFAHRRSQIPPGARPDVDSHPRLTKQVALQDHLVEARRGQDHLEVVGGLVVPLVVVWLAVLVRRLRHVLVFGRVVVRVVVLVVARGCWSPRLGPGRDGDLEE